MTQFELLLPLVVTVIVTGSVTVLVAFDAASVNVVVPESEPVEIVPPAAGKTAPIEGEMLVVVQFVVFQVSVVFAYCAIVDCAPVKELITHGVFVPPPVVDVVNGTIEFAIVTPALFFAMARK